MVLELTIFAKRRPSRARKGCPMRQDSLVSLVEIELNLKLTQCYSKTGNEKGGKMMGKMGGKKLKWCHWLTLVLEVTMV